MFIKKKVVVKIAVSKVQFVKVLMVIPYVITVARMGHYGQLDQNSKMMKFTLTVAHGDITIDYSHQ